MGITTEAPAAGSVVELPVRLPFGPGVILLVEDVVKWRAASEVRGTFWNNCLENDILITITVVC